MTLPFSYFVGGDISRDGKEIVMKTYQNIYYWPRKMEKPSKKPSQKYHRKFHINKNHKVRLFAGQQTQSPFIP